MPGESQQVPGSAPDPSVFTTDQLLRTVHAERDYTDSQLDVLRQRLADIDRATKLLNETVNRTPTDIQKEITHQRELNAVEFASIGLQFKERDTRSDRESRDNKVAVDAAFAAQKEAAAKQDDSNQKSIDKSEKATAETITKVSELLKTTTDGLADKIDDVKVRLSGLELQITGIIQSRAGGQEFRVEQRNQNAGIIAAVGLLVTLVLAVVTIVGFVIAGGGGP